MTAVVSVDDGSIPGSNFEEKQRNFDYWQSFNLDYYYDMVQSLTFKSEFVNLEQEQAKKLLKYLSSQSEESLREIQHLIEEINNRINVFKEGAFLKLSSRSPKDAVDKLPNKLIPILKRELQNHPNDPSGQFVAIRQAFMSMLQVNSAEEGLDLFSYSSRIVSDLRRVGKIFTF